MEREEASPAVADEANSPKRDQILNHLISNEAICFKSQQIVESDLTKQEKLAISSEIFEKSKLNFLTRFGKYLEPEQLNFFQQFTENGEEAYEIALILKDLKSLNNSHKVRNRRYQALKQLVEEDSYFTEIEMMKRNPLLYQQLIGQYLTEDEKRERDKPVSDGGLTLVKLLMEGIERDNAEIKKRQQENYEDDAMEESDSDDSKEPEPTYSRWGEFEEDARVFKKVTKVRNVTEDERNLFREEFITSMYESFLDGNDDDFNYDDVDNNDKYDNIDIKECDEEDKYFDSEEAEEVPVPGVEAESEDELDIYMSALNQNPAVCQLAEDMENLR